MREPSILDAYVSFRFRDYRLLLAGNFLTTIAMQTMSVAIGWDLYLATRSPVVLGNVGIAQVIPFLLFALKAGQYADRHNRKRILLITQVTMLACMALLAASTRSVWLIYFCLFLIATARAFQGPARFAILPHTIPNAALGNAITWNSSSNEIASIGGPALAGLLLAQTGSAMVYAIVFGFSLLSFGCFAMIRSGQPHVVASSQPIRITEGVRFVWGNKLLLSTMSLDMIAVLFGGATALLPIYAVDILHVGAQGLGWLRAAPCIGAVSMSLLMAHWGRIHRAGPALLWAVGGFGAATIVFGISRNMYLSFSMLVLTGVCDNVSVVLRHSLVQQDTPDALRGRVLAVKNIFISCSNQLGAVESGYAALLLGATGSVVSGGIATIAIVGIFVLCSRSLRAWKQ